MSLYFSLRNNIMSAHTTAAEPELQRAEGAFKSPRDNLMVCGVPFCCTNNYNNTRCG